MPQPGAKQAGFYLLGRAELAQKNGPKAQDALQFLSGGADFFYERSFDVHVNIFERRIPMKFSGINFSLDGVEAARNFCSFSFGDETGFG